VPPIVYDTPTDYGSTGVRYFQGIGSIWAPLKPGIYEVSLYDYFDLTEYLGLVDGEYVFVFDNSWTITVK
jgi:hypothetical protein